MNNKFLLDTNFICSLISGNDLHHKIAVEKYKILPQESEFYITDIIKLEIVFFQKKHPKLKSLNIKNLIKVLNIESIKIDEEFIKKFIKFCYDTNFNLKTIDYTILAAAVFNDCDLITFDKKLEKAYNKASLNI